jgi:ketosteroid isomerase-like protein
VTDDLVATTGWREGRGSVSADGSTRSPAPALDPEDVFRHVLALLDAGDLVAVADLLEDDVQGVDDLRRGWIHGWHTVLACWAELDGAVRGLRSQPLAVHVVGWDDAAVVTCLLDRRFALCGRPHRVTAPASITLRRRDGRWRVAVLHVAPPACDGLPAAT